MDYTWKDASNDLTLLINWLSGKLQEERKNETKGIIMKKRKILVKRNLKKKQSVTRKKKGGVVTRKEVKPNNKNGDEREGRQDKKRGGDRQERERSGKWMKWGGLLNSNPIILFSAHKDTG
uniref:Uncharacterized protein n=2 Tax=Micrurus TaxID=8634 RepID=A0A2H6MWG0_9SAUR